METYLNPWRGARHLQKVAPSSARAGRTARNNGTLGAAVPTAMTQAAPVPAFALGRASPGSRAPSAMGLRVMLGSLTPLRCDGHRRGLCAGAALDF